MTKIVHTSHDVHYLPTPNRVEIVLTDDLSPLELTRTAFMVPVYEDGSFLFAVNQRRGVEIPGGHIDDGETPEQAAIREAYEEAGCRVEDVRPLGYLRMISEGDVPDDWGYPHPVSYQQFFTGRITNVEPFTPNDECAEPMRFHDLGDDRITRPEIRILGIAARDRA